MSQTARIEARVSPDVQALIKRAAEIEGRSLTDFLVTAARNAALQTIKDAELIRLAREDQEAIARAILDPAPMNPALEKAFARHASLIETPDA